MNDIGVLMMSNGVDVFLQVAAVCHEAALCALTEDLDIARVHSRHFQQAIKMVTPRITPEMIDFYDTYNKQSQLHVI